MTCKNRITAALAMTLLASGCSTKPRNFSAMVQPAAATAPGQASEADTFTTCDQLVRKGHRGNFAAAAASGAATGVAMFGGAAAVAASGTVGMVATTTGTVLTAAIPVFGIAAGLGVNRLIRSGKERKYKRVMTECMGELGYEVVDWTRAPKRQSGTATLVQASVPPVAAPTAAPDIIATSER